MWSKEEQQERTAIRIGTVQPLECLLGVSKAGLNRGDVKRVYRLDRVPRQKTVQDLLTLVATSGSRISPKKSAAMTSAAERQLPGWPDPAP